MPNIFRAGKVYTHKKMKETAFLVVSVLDEDFKYVQLRVKWYLRRGGYLGSDDVIVSKSDFSQWYIYETK